MNLLLLFLFAAVRPVLGRRASIVLFESGCEIWVIVVADLQGDIGDRGVRLAQKADSQIYSCLMPRRKIVDLEIPGVQFPVPTERQESVQRLLPGKDGQSGHTVHSRCDPIEFRFWITIF